MNISPSDLWTMAIAELTRANADRKHPFRRCVLCTHADYPESRWVVSRGMDSSYTFTICTDSRSPKVRHIAADTKVTLLFYHSKKQLQIRIKARASILTDGPLYEKHFTKAANYPKDYSTSQAPGSTMSHELQLTDTMHFAVLQIVPVEWDILLLGKYQHQRAVYSYLENNWMGQSVVP